MKVGDLVRFIETWEIGVITNIVMVGDYKYYRVWMSSDPDHGLFIEAELDLVQTDKKCP